MATSKARRARRLADPEVGKRHAEHVARAYAARIADRKVTEEFFCRPLTNREIQSGQRDELFDAAYELGIDLPGMDDVPAPVNHGTTWSYPHEVTP